MERVNKITIITISISIYLYLIISLMSGSVNTKFKENCRPELPSRTCIIGNISGWLSSGVWYAVLLAQLLKDYYITKCRGLSVVWGWMNFNASCLNAYVIFSLNLPLFSKAMAIYMPILESLVLIQIFYYRSTDRNIFRNTTNALNTESEEHSDIKMSLFRWGICIIIWVIFNIIAILSFTEIIPVYIFNEVLSWTAIALWSMESFVQILYNMKIHSCEGQSYWGLGLTFFGKTWDFLVQYLLQMPGRYLWLAYFSTGSAMFNISQALWYSSHGSNKLFACFQKLFSMFIVIFLVFGGMSYVIIFERFQGNKYDLWVRNDAWRPYFFTLPLLLSSPLVIGWIYYRPKTNKPIEYAVI